MWPFSVCQLRTLKYKHSPVCSVMPSWAMFHITYESALRSMTWYWSPGKETKRLCFVISGIFPLGRCQVTRWNHSKSNIYRREGHYWLPGWHSFFFSDSQCVSCVCVCACVWEGTKDQLDALTNDIKGNANVVRTKLKCELNITLSITFHIGFLPLLFLFVLCMKRFVKSVLKSSIKIKLLLWLYPLTTLYKSWCGLFCNIIS